MEWIVGKYKSRVTRKEVDSIVKTRVKADLKESRRLISSFYTAK